MPTTRTSYAERSVVACTGWQRTPMPASILPVSPAVSNSAMRPPAAGAAGFGRTWIAKVSLCVSPLLKRTVAVRSYLPGASAAGSAKRSGMRSCWPVGTATVFPPDQPSPPGLGGPGGASDQRQSAVTVSRELLMMTICFSTLSPGVKLWSLLVTDAGFPPM